MGLPWRCATTRFIRDELMNRFGVYGELPVKCLHLCFPVLRLNIPACTCAWSATVLHLHLDFSRASVQQQHAPAPVTASAPVEAWPVPANPKESVAS